MTLQNGLNEESDSKFDLHVLNGRFRSRMVWLRGQVNKRLKSTRQQSRTSRTSRLGWSDFKPVIRQSSIAASENVVRLDHDFSSLGDSHLPTLKTASRSHCSHHRLHGSFSI